MRIREDYTEEAAVAFNIISLIDIVFFLLIFFLAATTFAQEERDAAVQLPGTYAPRALSAPPRQMIINITEAGEFRVGGKTCTAAELAGALEDYAKRRSDGEVLIRADERSMHKYFAQVADLCRHAGVGELKIGYMLKAGEYGPAQ